MSGFPRSPVPRLRLPGIISHSKQKFREGNVEFERSVPSDDAQRRIDTAFNYAPSGSEPETIVRNLHRLEAQLPFFERLAKFLSGMRGNK